ncbi:MAG: hypothetical protein HYY45_04410 [Deltaproteobacteria bacterium]|nr:hypothetical protein [Deltaproteobacteria bacterium]
MKTISNLILLLLLLVSLFYFFSYPGVDPDLWGHLFFGREILQSGKLPLQNLYSYTAPYHPWINHEWLAEVVFYCIFYFFGSPGLILLKVAIGSMVVWVLDLNIKDGVASRFVRVLALVWAMAVLSPGFNIRPQLFTYLLFTAFLFLFYGYEKGSKFILYWAPCLMILWVNLHGGFVAGLGALGWFSIWTVIRERRGGEASRLIALRIIVPLVLSVIFSVLNPYGLNLLSFLSKDLLFDRPITEWQPISFLDFSFLGFKLAVVVVALFCVRQRSFCRWNFLLGVVAALFAIRHQRHVPLFAIAAAPLLAKGIEGLLEWVKKRARESILAVGLFVLTLYQYYEAGRVLLEHRFQLVVDPREYPTQAVDFLRRNGIRGNLAVPFDWGEYFIWKLYPEIRVSIDGRYTTAYPLSLVEDNWNWMEGKKGWRKLLERYPSEIAITNRYHPVTGLLRKDPEWVYIYSDPVAFVFVRKTPAQEGLLARFREKRLLPPRPPPLYFPG